MLRSGRFLRSLCRGGVRRHAAPANFVTIGLKLAHFLHSRPDFRGKRLQFPAKCGPPATRGASYPSNPPSPEYGPEFCRKFRRVRMKGVECFLTQRRGLGGGAGNIFETRDGSSEYFYVWWAVLSLISNTLRAQDSAKGLDQHGNARRWMASMYRITRAGCELAVFRTAAPHSE